MSDCVRRPACWGWGRGSGRGRGGLPPTGSLSRGSVAEPPSGHGVVTRARSRRPTDRAPPRPRTAARQMKQTLRFAPEAGLSAPDSAGSHLLAWSGRPPSAVGDRESISSVSFRSCLCRPAGRCAASDTRGCGSRARCGTCAAVPGPAPVRTDSPPLLCVFVGA